MTAHQVGALKNLLFNSVGDVSDLIEEALKRFANQQQSISNILENFGPGTGNEMANASLQTDTSGAAIGEDNLSLLVAEIKQGILSNIAQAIETQKPDRSITVNSLLAQG